MTHFIFPGADFSGLGSQDLWVDGSNRIYSGESETDAIIDLADFTPGGNILTLFILTI